MRLRSLLIVTSVVSFAGTSFAAAQGFPHPLYMHGLQDLKQAEHSWYAAPPVVHNSKHGRLALQHINAAQYIIFKVAPSDHMDPKAAQSADAHPASGDGPVVDTQKYLQQALVDVSQKETDSKLERTRQRAISEVRGALYEVKAATAQASSAAGAPGAGPAMPGPAPRAPRS